MRRLYWLAAVVAILAVSGFVFLNFNYMLMEKEVFKCQEGDLECMEKARDYRDDCIPSKFSVTGENLTLIVDVERGLSECDYRETVEQTGYTVECTTEIGGSCPGSLLDYLAPPEGGGGGGGDSESEDGGSGDSGTPEVPDNWVRPEVYCSLNDIQCKEDSVEYVKNCLPATITDDDQRWSSGYWTKYITVDRLDGECRLYFEIINAVDVPPEVPPNIVGMTMECLVPIGEFPITEVTESWCTGELFDYLTI